MNGGLCREVKAHIYIYYILYSIKFSRHIIFAFFTDCILEWNLENYFRKILEYRIDAREVIERKRCAVSLPTGRGRSLVQ